MKPSRAVIGWTVLCVAFALRAGWIVYRWWQSGAALEYPDEELHLELATNLITKGELVSDDLRYAARMPLYPLLLALFAWLGDAGVLLARLVQAVMGAATAWVVYAFADSAFGRRAAIIAGTLACCDPYAVFFANLLLTEVPFTLIGVGLAALAWHLVAGANKLRRCAVAGIAVLGAAAIMTRPSAVGWVVLLWLLLWWLDANRRRGSARILICAVTLIVAMLPWGLRNRAAIGSFAWLSTNGGVTLYDAQGPQADGSSDQEFLQRTPELEDLSEVERDRRLFHLALEEMKTHPTRVLSLAAVKFVRTWSLTPNVAEYRGGATGIVSTVFMTAVISCAIVGVVRTRRRGRLHAMLWLPVVYFTVLHCLYVGSLRYRVPLMPFVEVAAAGAFVQTSSVGRAKPNTRAGANG